MNSERDLNFGDKPEQNTFEFGEFVFDRREKILRRDNSTISLPPKTCDLLAVLLENHGKLMTKDELFAAVWADSFVEEANLSHHIAVLRKAFAEGSGQTKFIETIPRRGYRFIGSLNEVPSKSIELTIRERSRTQTIVSEEIEYEESNRLEGNNSRISRRLVFGLLAAALIAIVSSLIWGVKSFRTTPNQMVSKLNFKRLMPDTDSYAQAISPDGTTIVFLKQEKGFETLWSRQIQSGEMSQILPAIDLRNELGISSTRFSADGNWIYFRRTEKNSTIPSVYRIGAKGGTPRKIIEGVESDFSLSPDGKRIAFTRDSRLLIVADTETPAEKIAAEFDGEKHLIDTDRLVSPAWSPDGARIIFGTTQNEETKYVRQLCEIDLATGIQKIIPVAEGFGVLQIEWHPSGRSLLVTGGADGQKQIWSISYPSGDTRLISDESDSFARLRLSADGNTFVAEQQFGQYNLWTAPFESPEIRKQITIGGAAQHGTLGVSFSPEGKIIYTARNNNAYDLYSIDRDGGNQKRLTINSGRHNYIPEFTADGRFLVFASKRTGISQIWRTDADGSNPVQLSKGSENWDFRISPENDIYYQSFSGTDKKYKVYKVPVTGGEPVLVDDFYYRIPPAFSPDGKWMLILGGKNHEETPRVSLIERKTGNIKSFFEIGNTIVRWLPDSKSFAYIDFSQDKLMRQSIEGGEPKLFADFQPNKISYFDISRDGKDLVLSLGNTTSEVVLFNNFKEFSK